MNHPISCSKTHEKNVQILGQTYNFTRYLPSIEKNIPDMPNCLYCKHLLYHEQYFRFIHCGFHNQYLCTLNDTELKAKKQVKLLRSPNTQNLDWVKWAACPNCSFIDQNRIPTRLFQDPTKSSLFSVPDCRRCLFLKEKSSQSLKNFKSEPHCVICNMYPYGKPADWNKPFGFNKCENYRPNTDCVDLYKLDQARDIKNIFALRKDVQEWAKRTNNNPYVCYGILNSKKVTAFLTPLYISEILKNMNQGLYFKDVFNGRTIDGSNFASLATFLTLNDTKNAEELASLGINKKKIKKAGKTPDEAKEVPKFKDIPWVNIPGKIFAYRIYGKNIIQKEQTTNSLCETINFSANNQGHQHFFDAHPETVLLPFNKDFVKFSSQTPDISNLAKKYKISPYFLGSTSKTKPLAIDGNILKFFYCFPMLLNQKVNLNSPEFVEKLESALSNGKLFSREGEVNLLTWLEKVIHNHIAKNKPSLIKDQVDNASQSKLSIDDVGNFHITVDSEGKIFQQTVPMTLQAAGKLPKIKAMLTNILECKFSRDSNLSPNAIFGLTSSRIKDFFELFMECQYLYDHHFGGNTKFIDRSVQNSINILLATEFYALANDAIDTNITRIKKPSKDWKKDIRNQKTHLEKTSGSEPEPDTSNINFRKAIITGFLYHFYYTHGAYLSDIEIHFMVSSLIATSKLKSGILEKNLKTVSQSVIEELDKLNKGKKKKRGSKTVALPVNLEITNREMHTVIQNLLNQKEYKTDRVFRTILFDSNGKIKDPNKLFNWAELRQQIGYKQIENNPATARLARLIYYAERRMMKRAMAWGIRTIQNPINDILKEIGHQVRENPSKADYYTDLRKDFLGHQKKDTPDDSSFHNLTIYQRDRVKAFVSGTVEVVAERLSNSKLLLRTFMKKEPLISAYFTAKIPINVYNAFTMIPGESMKIFNASPEFLFLRTMANNNPPFKNTYDIGKWKLAQKDVINKIKGVFKPEDLKKLEPLINRIRSSGTIGYFLPKNLQTNRQYEKISEAILPFFGKKTTVNQLKKIFSAVEQVEESNSNDLIQKFPTLLKTIKTDTTDYVIVSPILIESITELANYLVEKIIVLLKTIKLSDAALLVQRAKDQKVALDALKDQFRTLLTEESEKNDQIDSTKIMLLNKMLESWLKLKVLESVFMSDSSLFQYVLYTYAFIDSKLPRLIASGIANIIKNSNSLQNKLKLQCLPYNYKKFETEFLGVWSVFLLKSLGIKFSAFSSAFDSEMEGWSLQNTNVFKKPTIGSMPVSESNDCVIGLSMVNATEAAINKGTIPFELVLNKYQYKLEAFKQFVCYPASWQAKELPEIKNSSLQEWFEELLLDIGQLREAITENESGTASENGYLRQKAEQICFVLQKVQEMSLIPEITPLISDYFKRTGHFFTLLGNKLNYKFGQYSVCSPNKMPILSNSILLKQGLGHIGFVNRYLVWNQARESRRVERTDRPNHKDLIYDRKMRYTIIKDKLFPLLISKIIKVNENTKENSKNKDENFILKGYIKVPKKIQASLATDDKKKWTGIIQNVALLCPQFPSHTVHANMTITYENEPQDKGISALDQSLPFTTIKSIMAELEANACILDFDSKKFSFGSHESGTIIGIDLNRVHCLRQTAYGFLKIQDKSKIKVWDLNVPLSAGLKKELPLIGFIMGIDERNKNNPKKDSALFSFTQKLLKYYFGAPVTPDISLLSQPSCERPFGGWGDGDRLEKTTLYYPQNAYEQKRLPTLADLFGAIIYYFAVKRQHLKNHIVAVARRMKNSSINPQEKVRLRSEIQHLNKKFLECRHKMLEIMIRETALLIIGSNASAVAGENLHFQKTIGKLARIQAGMVKGVSKFWIPVKEMLAKYRVNTPQFRPVSPWGTSKYDFNNMAMLQLNKVELESFSFDDTQELMEDNHDFQNGVENGTEPCSTPASKQPQSEQKFLQLQRLLKSVLCLDDNATSADWGVVVDLEHEHNIWRVTPRHDSAGVSIAARFIEECQNKDKDRATLKTT